MDYINTKFAYYDAMFSLYDTRWANLRADVDKLKYDVDYDSGYFSDEIQKINDRLTAAGIA